MGKERAIEGFRPRKERTVQTVTVRCSLISKNILHHIMIEYRQLRNKGVLQKYSDVLKKSSIIQKGLVTQVVLTKYFKCQVIIVMPIF